MNENPYAPPIAPVADAEVPVSLDRPHAVDRAVRLLWLGFGVSFLASIAVLFTIPAGGAVVVGVLTAVVALGISFGICYWIFTAAWRGRGWARWVIAVFGGLALIGIIAMRSVLPQPQATGWITTASFVIRMGLNIVALVLLFSAPANAWYREIKRWR